MEALVELLHHVGQLEVGRRLERIVIAQQGERNTHRRQELAASRIVDPGQILRQALRVQERRNGGEFFGFLVDHHRHADSAVRMAAAAQLAPFRGGSVDQIGEVGEGAHERDREPIANGFAHVHLVLHVVGQMRQRVALRGPALIGDGLIAASERNRLEREERNLLGIVQREADHRAHLLIIDAVDDGDHGNDFHARAMQVIDGLQLHVEQVPHRAVRIGFVSDSVELQIGVAQAGFGGLGAEFLALGEFDAVGGGLNAVITHLAGVTDGVQEEGRKSGLAARELDRHLAARLDLRGVVQQSLDIFPAQFMHEPDLVCVHEARVAHHVAAVGKIDGEHGAAAMRDGAGSMVVHLFVVVRADVAAREDVFQVLEERRVHGHHVFEVAVDRAILHHQDLAVAFDDVGFDLADFLVQEDLVRQFAVHDLLPDFGDAFRTKGIGFPRPAQGRLHLLVAFEKRLVGPFGDERRILTDLV